MGQLRSALRAYDPATAELRVATAGHLPPLLSGPAQTTRYLELDAGLPLGVGDIEFVDTTLTLPGQTTLVLCTDGLVESRQRSLSDGLEHLAQVVARSTCAPSRPASTCWSSCTQPTTTAPPKTTSPCSWRPPARSDEQCYDWQTRREDRSGCRSQPDAQQGASDSRR